VALSLPLAAATAHGVGYSRGNPYNFAQDSLLTSFSSQLFLLMTLVVGFSLVLRFGRRWYIPTVIAQSVSLAIAGQRLEIFLAAVALTVALFRTGVKPNRGTLTL